MNQPTLIVGGLGSPHDLLAAASLRALGHDAITLGDLDDAAAEQGRAALPRGQCAPALHTTGALLRTVAEHGHKPLAYLSAHTCGPCRYAMFEAGWRRALNLAGLPAIVFAPLVPPFGSAPSSRQAGMLKGVIDALLAADVLAESVRRMRPYVQDVQQLERLASEVVARVEQGLAAGASAVAMLRAERGWHRGLAVRPAMPLARAVIIGDPWSVHVQGDGQMNLPRVLAAAGVEVEVPPLALWMNYLLWQVRQPAWGASPEPTDIEVSVAADLEQHVAASLSRLSQALGMAALDLPGMDDLATWAAPHLPPSFRGGYGHIEVALAVRAAQQRRAHVVFSVKSFGCLPSGAVSDEIVPTALAGALPFLAVEVCADGAAARESRLMLRVAAAVQRAQAEFQQACAQRGVTVAEILGRPVLDPLQCGPYGPRSYACSLACGVIEDDSGLPVASCA